MGAPGPEHERRLSGPGRPGSQERRGAPGELLPEGAEFCSAGLRGILVGIISGGRLSSGFLLPRLVRYGRPRLAGRRAAPLRSSARRLLLKSRRSLGRPELKLGPGGFPMTSPRSPRLLAWRDFRPPANQRRVPGQAGTSCWPAEAEAGGGGLGGWQRVPERAGWWKWSVPIPLPHAPTLPEANLGCWTAETQEGRQKRPRSGKKTNPTPPLYVKASSPLGQPMPGRPRGSPQRGQNGRNHGKAVFTQPSASSPRKPLSDCVLLLALPPSSCLPSDELKARWVYYALPENGLFHFPPG